MSSLKDHRSAKNQNKSSHRGGRDGRGGLPFGVFHDRERRAPPRPIWKVDIITSSSVNIITSSSSKRYQSKFPTAQYHQSKLPVARKFKTSPPKRTTPQEEREKKTVLVEADKDDQHDALRER